MLSVKAILFLSYAAIHGGSERKVPILYNTNSENKMCMNVLKLKLLQLFQSKIKNATNFALMQL